MLLELPLELLLLSAILDRICWFFPSRTYSFTEFSSCVVAFYLPPQSWFNKFILRRIFSYAGITWPYLHSFQFVSFLSLTFSSPRFLICSNTWPYPHNIPLNYLIIQEIINILLFVSDETNVPLKSFIMVWITAVALLWSKI